MNISRCNLDKVGIQSRYSYNLYGFQNGISLISIFLLYHFYLLKKKSRLYIDIMNLLLILKIYYLF